MNKKFLSSLPYRDDYYSISGDHIIKTIEYKDGIVLKKTSYTNMLTFDILLYFSKQYNKMMGTNKFIVEKICNFRNNMCAVKFQHPLLCVSLKQFITPKSKLYKKTNELLENYKHDCSTLLYNFLKNNPIIHHIVLTIGEDKFNRDNYFTYQGNFYLLDIENFYFRMFDANNNILSKEDIKNGYIGNYYGNEEKFPIEKCYVL